MYLAQRGLTSWSSTTYAPPAISSTLSPAACSLRAGRAESAPWSWPGHPGNRCD